MWKIQNRDLFYLRGLPELCFDPLKLQQQTTFFHELSICPDRYLLFFVAKSKARLEYQNTGPLVVFTSFMYNSESSSKLLFPHFLTCAIPVGTSKTNVLPVLADFTCAFKVPIVNSPLIRTEPILFLFIGEICHIGYKNLTFLLCSFFMKIFDDFTLKLFVLSDVRMLSTFSWGIVISSFSKSDVWTFSVSYNFSHSDSLSG